MKQIKQRSYPDERRNVKRRKTTTISTALFMIDIITLIFELLPQTDWFRAMMTCKKWNEVGRRIFDPSKVPNLRSRIFKLIEKNNVIGIRYLLNERGINPCMANHTILVHAARYASVEIMRELFKYSQNRKNNMMRS
jgi:hypothetical protein